MASRESQVRSSITTTAANRFAREADERATLWCKRINGLHLIKLKAGAAWRYRYQDATGKRRVATIGKLAKMPPPAAVDTVLQWEGEKVDPLALKRQERTEALREQQAREQRTLRAYLEGPYAKHQERKATGADTIKLLMFSFSEFLDRDMATLAPEDLHQWQDARESQGRAYTTIRRQFSALKTMFRHAHKSGFLPANPLADARLKQQHHAERDRELSSETDRREERRPLTPDEMERLHAGLDAFGEEIRRQRRNSREHGRSYLADLDAVPHPHWFIPFAYFAMFTGMRPGDLYTLRWQELSLPFKRLIKYPNKTKHHPNPAKLDLSLDPRLVAIMTDWHEQQGKPASGLVFPSPVTGRRMDKKAHNKPWKRVKQLGGLHEDLTFYALRHHFISTLVADGVPMLTVARLVGHKGAAMIENHYSHLIRERADAALSVIANSIGRRQEVAR